jgi:hypothetical protein
MNYSREEKAKLLEGWRRSGKSISAYVRERPCALDVHEMAESGKGGKNRLCGSNSGGRETKNASAADTH